ncbi:Sec1 family domain-containing protein 2, partial [Ophiophagus hannah]
MEALLQAGALNVKEFSSFESGEAEQPKAVFVVSTVLKGQTVDVVRDIVSLSHFQYCVVFTGVSHAVHLQAYNTPPGAEAESSGPVVFEQFEEKLCQWMGNMNYTAEVHHAALFLAPLSPHLFVTPAFAALFPLMAEDLMPLNRARPEKKKISHLSDVDFFSLPSELQLAIRSLVSDLNSLLEYLSVREECFAVGSLSKIIAGDLANYSQAKLRRKNAQNKAAIIFVDRTLDLTGAVGHHGDNLAEKILSILPKLPGHTNDVMVNMMELTSLHTNETSCNIIAPGCLAQPIGHCHGSRFLILKPSAPVGEVKTGKELNEAESQVKEAFIQAICDEPELSPLLQKIIATACDEEPIGEIDCALNVGDRLS